MYLLLLYSEQPVRAQMFYKTLDLEFLIWVKVYVVLLIIPQFYFKTKNIMKQLFLEFISHHIFCNQFYSATVVLNCNTCCLNVAERGNVLTAADWRPVFDFSVLLSNFDKTNMCRR